MDHCPRTYMWSGAVFSGGHAGDAQYCGGEEPFALALLCVGEDFLWLMDSVVKLKDARSVPPRSNSCKTGRQICSTLSTRCRRDTCSTHGLYRVGQRRGTSHPS
jgi:hypothetical protein